MAKAKKNKKTHYYKVKRKKFYNFAPDLMKNRGKVPIKTENN